MAEFSRHATTNANEVFLDTDNKLLKKCLTKFNDESNEKSVKCKPEEVNELLSLKQRLLQQPRYERNAVLSEAQWDDDLKLAKVTKVAKNLTKNFSHSRNKSMYLYPEECLCLLEMKCLVLTWKGKKLSIKHAFALLLNFDSGCTFEEFRTFGYLVKLGFRVFRHDEKIKSSQHLSPKDLIKQPVKAKTKKFTGNKQIKNSQDSKNKVIIPNVNYSGRVIISKPPVRLLPHNLQPNYDTYSYNLSIESDGQIKITEVTSNNSKCQDLQSIAGVYPVYEKNIPVIETSVNYQNKDGNYMPPAKKSKFTKFEDKNIPVLTNETVITSNVKRSLSTLNENANSFDKVLDDNIKSEEIVEIKSEHLNCPHNEIMNSKDKSNVSNNETKTMNNLLNKNQLNDEEINSNLVQNFNSTEKNRSNCELKKLSTNSTFGDNEDNVFDNQLNVPSHIGEKLFAIKSKTIDKKLTADHRKEYRIHYDVYYPDNKVAKTTRSAPNFRVIVFKDGEPFPNIYQVTCDTPNDNVPMLWAIVNSSQVSFYNVDGIILPKSSEWEI